MIHKFIFAILVILFANHVIASQYSLSDAQRALDNGDTQTAFEIYEVLAMGGNARAQMILGQFYYSGEIVPKNIQTAIKWYEKAIENGIRPIDTKPGIFMKVLAQAYFEIKDYKNAAIWARKSAEKGNGDAAGQLAWQYSAGLGVIQDYREVAKWAEIGAKKGNLIGQYYLGWIHSAGHGVIKDYYVAEKWLLEASKRDLDLAQFQLALVYLQRYFDNDEKDISNLIKSYMWINIARANNNEDADKVISKIDEMLSNSEKKRAMSAARSCFNSNYRNCLQ